MRRVACVLAALAALGGCGDDPTATIVIELAPEPLTEACNLSSSFEPADPEQIETLHFLLCPAGPVPCIDRDPTSLVPVQPLEGPIAAGDGGSAAAPGIFVERNIAFDARLPGGMPLRVEVIACAGDTAIARGVVDDARLGEDDLRVRLYRYDAVSCAGPRVEGTLPLPRGFHAMTRLGNGDILVYGGVTGSEASAPGDGPAGLETWRGLALEQRVEVYRPSQERFLPVSITDDSSEPGGFRRVLFTSTLLDAPADGPQRIRVYGGLTAGVGNAVLRFDQNQNRSALGAPILPHPAAEVASTVDLIYDPAARTLRIEAVAPGASVIPKHVASASTPPGEGPGVLALGLASNGESTQFAEPTDPLVVSQLRWNAGMQGPPNLPLPQGTYVIVGSDGATSGDGMMMLSGRFGHTATSLGAVAPGATLVWGGNVYEMDDATRDARTGELILPGGGTTAVEAGAVTGLPPSTAFHTATALSDSEVLRAGGRVVGCVTPVSGCATPISQALATPALAVLRRSGATFVQDPVTGAAESTIFHAATPAYADPDDAAGAPLTTFVTGGAGTALAPSAQIVQVTRGPTGYVAESPFTQVVGGMPRAARLGEARLGHAAVQVSPRRILVTGGLVVGGGTVEAIGTAEVIAWDPEAFWNPCPARPEGGGAPVFPDGGVDAGPLPLDAGFDAAPPPGDSGIGADSGGDSGL